MRVTLPNISNLEELGPLKRFTSVAIQAISDVLNGRIGFLDNCETSFVTITVSTTGADVPVNHTLNRMPNGYLVVGSSAQSIVYDGTQAFNTSQIFIRVSAATTLKLLIF